MSLRTNRKSYDQALLEYYYGKDINQLKSTEAKYKKYATILAKKCEDLKSKITVLYDDFRQATTLYQNANRISTHLRKTQQDFENGIDKKDKFFWCPPDDEEDEEEIIEEFRRDDNIRGLEMQKKTLTEVRNGLLPIVQSLIGGEVLSAVCNSLNDDVNPTPESLESESVQLLASINKVQEQVSNLEEEITLLRFKIYLIDKALPLYSGADIDTIVPETTGENKKLLDAVKTIFTKIGTNAKARFITTFVDRPPAGFTNTYFPSNFLNIVNDTSSL